MNKKRFLLVILVLVSALAVAGAVYAQGGGGRGGRGHSGGHHSGGIGGRGTQPNYNYNYQDGCLFGDYGAPGTGLNPNMPNFFNFNNECALGEDCTAPGWNRQGGTWGGMMGGFGGQGSMMGVQGGVAVYGELEQEQIDALTLGLQDEINAYAFYGAVIEQFGPVYPFTQIQRSESMHAAALQAAFERYGLEVPEIIPADPPAFASAADACAIAAQTESDNMALYDANLAAVQAYPDLVQVFTNLRNASEFMHLPAFQRCAG